MEKIKIFKEDINLEQQAKDIEAIQKRTDLTLEEKLIEAGKLGIPLEPMREALAEAGGINIETIPNAVVVNENNNQIAI